MEKKFNLNYVSSKTNEKVKFYKEERSIHSVQPSGETAENLNQDDILQFAANLTNNPHDIFESTLMLEGKIQERADANAAWTDLLDATEVSLELSAFYKMFKEMSIKSANDSYIEKVNHPGEVASINQFLMYDYNYPNTDGQLNLFIPDTGSGDHTNTEYLKRKAIIGKKFQVMLPLDVVFGFLTYVRVSMSNILLTLELQRDFNSKAANQRLFYGNGIGGDKEFRIQLSRARWLIPYTRLNESSKLAYNKQLTNNYSYSFLANQMSYHQVASGSDDFRIGIGNIGANIHEIYTVFKNPTRTFDTNNSLYIQNYNNHKITGLSWDIDDKPYPPTNFKFQFDNTENKLIIPFKNYLDITQKRYGVMNPILGYQDFNKLYNLYGIDLTAQDPNYLNKNTSIAISMEKTQDFKPNMYILAKVEKHITLDPAKSTGDGQKSTTISLVGNSKSND